MAEEWTVGYVQNGPLHDAGLRCFVARKARGEWVPIAWTRTQDDAERIIAGLELLAN
jgi:hypothetical protein